MPSDERPSRPRPHRLEPERPRDPKPRTASEIDLIANILRELVPERHISPELLSDFLTTYRQGGDITRFLLERVSSILQRLDEDFTDTARGAEELRHELDSLERITSDLKSSFNEMALIDEMVSAERGHRTLHDVLESFIDLLERTLPLAAVQVYLIDPETRRFAPAAARNLRPAQSKEVGVRLEEGTFAWSIREGGPVVLPVTMPPEQGRTLVAAPLMLGRDALGVACLFSELADAEYTPQHFQILRSLIKRATISIDNARRVQRLEAESRRVAGMKDYLNLIVDNMAQGVLVIDADDAITLYNRTAELIFGEPAEEVLGARYDEALPHDLVKFLRHVLSRTRRDDPVVDYEFGFDRGEGVSFRLGVSSALLRDAEGGGGVVVTCRDLFTARELMRLRQSDRFKTRAIDQFRESLRDVERRLQRSEKLASIGQMAAGVAHEINNPLGSIAGFIQILLMDREEEDGDRSYLEAMQKEVERMKGIVEGLLDFARQQPGERQTFLPVDMNLIVRETLRLVEPQARMSHVEVRTHLTEGLEPVMGLADRLKQVLMNMALNAFFAMDKEKRTLEVTTRLVEEEEGTLVEVELADNGTGIRREDLQRIFDPFFTTREQGQGTGLGLSTCFGIVQQHGGEILVESAWGEGSSFTVRLPVGDLPEEAPPPPPAPAPANWTDPRD
jgi:two-component system NtrC family sensor kinase